MITMAMKGNVEKQLYLQHSYSKLSISGHFGIKGPQIVGGKGGAPEQVAQLLEQNPHIEAVAIITENGGAVYSRL